MQYNNRNRTLKAVKGNLEDSKQSKKRNLSQERLIAEMQSEISVLKLKVRKLDQLVTKYIENKNTTQEQQEEQLEEEQLMEPLTPLNERTGALQRLSRMDQLQLSDL
ncbi:hypothetical protein C0J50_3026 [Silurus asotus]|uniref:Uncharacterized protein n=1 Tax=Silurus asotus TaxID=30991 RepID=A0AAD5B5Q0_SILAS|nr:hypothetical protein C0J50_3026 [Silurus asotus]